MKLLFTIAIIWFAVVLLSLLLWGIAWLQFLVTDWYEPIEWTKDFLQLITPWK